MLQSDNVVNATGLVLGAFGSWGLRCTSHHFLVFCVLKDM